MNEPVPSEPPALTASTTAASLIALAEHAPTRARAAMATALAELAVEDWAWLGLEYRGHTHSPNAALSRVLALAAARLGTTDTHTLDHWARPATDVEILEVPMDVEIRGWARRPVREDCYDLQLHAERARPPTRCAPPTRRSRPAPAAAQPTTPVSKPSPRRGPGPARTPGWWPDREGCSERRRPA